jgi:Cellulose binding domain
LSAHLIAVTSPWFRSMLGPSLCLWALAACADLHAPPSLGQAGAGGTNAASGSGSGGLGSGSGAPAQASAPNAGGGSVGGNASVAGNGPSGGSPVGGNPSGSSGSPAGAAPVELAGDGGVAGGGGDDQVGGSLCGSVTNGDIHAWLFRELEAATSNEIHPFIALTTTGPAVPLAQLSIRYYFSAEGSGDWQVDCIWVTKEGGSGGGLCDAGAEMKVVALDAPAPQADHYLEVTFAGVASETLSQVSPPVFEARSMFWRDGHPSMSQSNDYSFVPTTSTVMTVENRAYKETTKVTVYRNGALIWGEEPCP